MVLSSCKDQKTGVESSDQAAVEDGLVTMRGEFIYHNDAAVLQTKNSIYGVVLDDMAETLREEVKPFQNTPLDMITVTLRAKRIAKPEGEDGWPFSIEIKEILKIEQAEPGAQNVIELSK